MVVGSGTGFASCAVIPISVIEKNSGSDPVVVILLIITVEVPIESSPVRPVVKLMYSFFGPYDVVVRNVSETPPIVISKPVMFPGMVLASSNEYNVNSDRK